MRRPISRVLAFTAVMAIGSLSVAPMRAQKPTSTSVIPGNVERVRLMLVEQIGVDLKECGKHPKPLANNPDVAASVSCVLDAAKKDRAAWMVVYGHDATDSVQGVFSKPGGFVRRFYYDAKGFLGDGRATLEVGPCEFPKVSQKDDGDGGRFVAVDCLSRYAPTTSAR